VIVKVHKKSNFVSIDNKILNDDELSWKAKGLLCYLLSKPNDWQVRLGDLNKKGKDGRESVRSGMKELLDIGYAQKNVFRDNEGKFTGVEYVIFEQKTVNAFSDNG